MHYVPLTIASKIWQIGGSLLPIALHTFAPLTKVVGLLQALFISRATTNP